MITLRYDAFAKADEMLAQLPIELRRGALERGVRNAAQVVVKRAKELVPKPGYPGDKQEYKSLRDTITYVLKRYGMNDEILVVVIGPERPAGAHGHLVHDGTRPHEVIASAYVSQAPIRRGRSRERIIRRMTTMERKRVLSSMGTIYGTRAKHPGQRANPFLANAAKETKEMQEGRMIGAIARAIDKHIKDSMPEVTVVNEAALVPA